MGNIYKFHKDENLLIDFESSWENEFKKKGVVKIIAFKNDDDLTFNEYPFLELNTVWFNTDGSDVIFILKNGLITDKIPLNKLIGIIKRGE